MKHINSYIFPTHFTGEDMVALVDSVYDFLSKFTKDTGQDESYALNVILPELLGACLIEKEIVPVGAILPFGGFDTNISFAMLRMRSQEWVGKLKDAYHRGRYDGNGYYIDCCISTKRGLMYTITSTTNTFSGNVLIHEDGVSLIVKNKVILFLKDKWDKVTIEQVDFDSIRDINSFWLYTMNR